MKKKLSTFIILAMLIATIPMTVSALVVGEWEIEISGNEATIIGYSGVCTDKMTLPTQIGNYPVVGISDKNKYDTPIFSDNVSEIVFPEGYRHIKGYYIFENLKDTLKSVTLPQSLEIFEASFFEFSKITEITIPPKVKEIGLRQFAWCDNLEHVYLNEGLEVIKNEAFQSNDKMKDVIIPNTVQKIHVGVFDGCSSLKHMIIPDSVTPVTGPSGGSIFKNCKNLETVIWGKGMTTLYSSECSYCPNLKSIYFDGNLEKISEYNFGCSSESIKTVVIPEGIEWFGSSTFKDCVNLEAIILPRSITRLGDFETFTSNGSPLPKLFLYGYKGTEAEKFAYNKGFPFVDISVATPTNSKVLIDGKEVAFTAYNIGGNNYFKLRDIASAINGTNKNFNVGWDGNNNAITLNSKTAYTNVGGELVVNSNATATEPQISNPKIFVDGKLTTFMAFNIADNNYIKLRDLGEVFDFSVIWNDGTQTIEINTNKTYTK